MGASVSCVGRDIAEAVSGTLRYVEDIAPDTVKVYSVLVQANEPHLLEDYASHALRGVGEIAVDEHESPRWMAVYPRWNETTRAMYKRLSKTAPFSDWHQLELRDFEGIPAAVIRK